MSNIDTATITQQGSMTRLTIGPAAPEPSAVPYEHSRVHTGALRHSNGEVTQHGTTTWTNGQDRPAGSVIATLQRDRMGESVELIPGVAGSRTHIRMALADGLIEQVGPGIYRDLQKKDDSLDAGEGPASAPEDAPAVDPGFGVFDAAEDEAWNADIEPLSQSGYDAASASITTAILSGSNNLEGAAQRLAEAEAIPVELASEYIAEGIGYYERVVAKEAASIGIDGTEKEVFYAWLQASKGRALQDAIGSLTAGRDVSKFRNLALEYSAIRARGGKLS